MKRSAIIFFILSTFIGSIIWYGKSIPELSHISASKSFNHTIEELWQLIFDYQKYPEWRENVYAVQKIPSTTDYDAWKEVDEDGNTVPYQLVEFNHNSYIIMEETGDSHKTTGKWRFEVTQNKDNQSAKLTISEDRLFPDLLPRVISHLLTNRTESIDSYFRSIDNKFIGDARRAKRDIQKDEASE